MLLYYLNWENQRVVDKGSAKTFYTQDSAVSALVIMKAKWETPTTSTKKSESEETGEKKSWSEL